MRACDFKRQLSHEAGFVIPLALILLLVFTALMGAAIAVATSNSSTTTHDSNSKAALAAAEAGLQVASYRLSELKPSEAQCINEEEAVTPSGGYCKEPTAENIGNSQTFQYTTTPALATGAKCAGETVTAVSGFVQRCVTSEGKVSGKEPVVRLQALVETEGVSSLFSTKGILGLSEVNLSNGATISAAVASNGTIYDEGGSKIKAGTEVCSPGKVKTGGGGTVEGGEKTRNATTECPIKAVLSSTHAKATENEDSRITKKEDTQTEAGYNNPGFTGANAYELSLNSSPAELTLKGSKYYFCNVSIAGKLKIPANVGHTVEIFVGYHGENSNCSSSAGKFEVTNGGKIENLTNNSADLLIQVAGEGPVTMNGGSSLNYGSIFAPSAQVNLNNGASLVGAIVGNKVKYEGGAFTYSPESAKITGSNGGSGLYSRQAWVQCTPSGTTPETGC